MEVFYENRLVNLLIFLLKMYKRVAVVQFVHSYNCFAHINRIQPGLQSFNVSLSHRYVHNYMIHCLTLQNFHSFFITILFVRLNHYFVFRGNALMYGGRIRALCYGVLKATPWKDALD